MSEDTLNVAPGSRLTIRNCPLCDGMHEELELHKYLAEFSGYTHWIECPTTGQPIPIGAHPQEQGIALLEADVLSQLNLATQAGRYLLFLYRLEDQRLFPFFKTQNFPHDDFRAALDEFTGHLNNDMRQAGYQPLDAEPTPAESLPTVYLFAGPESEPQTP